MSDLLPEFLPDDLLDGALDDVAGDLEDEYVSFRRREPAMLRSLLAAPLLGVGTGLAKAGVIAPGDAPALTSSLTGLGVTLGVGLTGLAIRRVVSPTWKRFTGRELPDIDD